MEDAATRELEHARELASTSAFRIVVAFCGLGAVDLVTAVARFVMTVVVPAPADDVMGPAAAFATGWGLGSVALVVAACALKLAVVVSIHRRRLNHAEPLVLWVLAGLFGVGARVGSAIVGYGHVAWISRTFDTRTLAAWSFGSSVTAFVDLLLDGLFFVVILAITALGVQRDRRRPAEQATYRSPGLR